MLTLTGSQSQAKNITLDSKSTTSTQQAKVVSKTIGKGESVAHKETPNTNSGVNTDANIQVGDWDLPNVYDRQGQHTYNNIKIENNSGRDENLFGNHSSKKQEYHNHNYHKDSYVFDRPTQEAYNEAQNIKKVMSSKVKLSNGQEQPLFSQKNNQTISVITHQDGTVSVGISGNNPQQIAKLQRALDNLPDNQGKLPNGQRKYRVGTETLTEKQGVMQGVGRDGRLSNRPGQCAEPHCATSSGRNSSPITGSITIWRGKPEDLKHAYTGNPKTKFGDDQMDPCPTYTLSHNQQIYHEEAIKSQNKITNSGNNTTNSTTNQESKKR